MPPDVRVFLKIPAKNSNHWRHFVLFNCIGLRHSLAVHRGQCNQIQIESTQDGERNGRQERTHGVTEPINYSNFNFHTFGPPPSPLLFQTFSRAPTLPLRNLSTDPEIN